MTLTIRPVTAADQIEWRRLWTGYLEYYETSVAEEVYQTSFARLLSEDEEEFNGHIAELDGRAVGLVHFLFHRHMWRVEKVCYLQDLYADTDVRGQGIGRKLIESVYDSADTNGCPRVYWLTQDFNDTARRLYDRVGQVTPFIKYDRPKT